MTPTFATTLHLFALGAIAATLALVSALWQREFPVWSDDRAITYEEAAALGPQAIWIDARSDKQYKFGHAPGAINLTERDWDAGIERFLSTWQPDQTIVVYCDSGGCRTGHHVADHLERDLGVKPRVLVGGWTTLQTHQRSTP